MKYNITLPRDVEVDIFNLPSDFDEIVLKCFAEYTNGTSRDYRDVDRLGFMDCLVRRISRCGDAEDIVYDLLHRRIDYELRENGSLPCEEDIFCTEFMEECCNAGMRTAKLSGRYGIDNHHIYDEIHKVVARIMVVVACATEDKIAEALRQGAK